MLSFDNICHILLTFAPLCILGECIAILPISVNLVRNSLKCNINCHIVTSVYLTRKAILKSSTH